MESLKKSILWPLLFVIPMFALSNLTAQSHSLNFDGTDDFVEVPHTPSLLIGANPLTIEFWFKAPNISQWGTFIIKRQPSSPFSSVGISINDGTDPRFNPVSGKKISFTFGTASAGGDFRAITTTNDVIDGQFHHLAAVVDPGSGNLFLYIDGILSPVNTISTGPFPTLSITNRYVLGQNNGNQSHYAGLLDEMRIWNTARSQSQVQSFMNTELSGSETGLVAYYKFDRLGSSCDIDDCNANENHGTRIGTGGANNLPQYSLDIPSLQDVACGVNTACSSPLVPTLSQWGLIMMALIFLNIGALAIRRKTSFSIT